MRRKHLNFHCYSKTFTFQFQRPSEQVERQDARNSKANGSYRIGRQRRGKERAKRRMYFRECWVTLLDVIIVR